MILDEMEPDSGSISLPKNMRISCLRQHLEDSDSPLSLLDYTADAIPNLKSIQNACTNLTIDSMSKNCLTIKEKRFSTNTEHCSINLNNSAGILSGPMPPPRSAGSVLKRPIWNVRLKTSAAAGRCGPAGPDLDRASGHSAVGRAVELS